MNPREPYEGEGGEGKDEEHGGVEQLHDDDRDGQGYCDAVGDSSHQAIPTRGWTRMRLYTP